MGVERGLQMKEEYPMRNPSPHPVFATALRMATVMTVALLVSACGEKQENAEIQAPLVMVEAVSLADYQPSTSISGEIQARIQTDLAFRVGGKIISRNVDIGDHVKTGQVLMTLDNTEQKADVTIAEATLRAAVADLKQKQLSFDRYQTLYQTRAVAQQTLDQAQEDLTTAQSSLQSAQASLETAKDTLSYTELKADADGVITARDVDVGSVVSAAQAALTIAHDGPRDAIFDIDESFFLKGEPTSEVQVAPINDPAQKVTATIREKSPVINTDTGTIRVKLALPKGTDWMLGTPVVAAFTSPSAKGFVLPWSAMSWQNAEPAVWLIDKTARTVSLKPVAIALYRAGNFVVGGGLQPGDMVVTDGGKLLRPGEVVDWKGQ